MKSNGKTFNVNHLSVNTLRVPTPTQDMNTPSSSNRTPTTPQSVNSVSQIKRNSMIHLAPLPEHALHTPHTHTSLFSHHLETKEQALFPERMRRNSEINAIYIADLPFFRDEAACLHGILPLCLLATQISTARHKNIFSYRSNGPIPTGLYDRIIKLRPKRFASKGKTSNWGVMEGRVPIDSKFGRCQLLPSGHYEFRQHLPADFPRDEKGEIDLPKEELRITLRTLYSDIHNKKPPKYLILPRDPNSDENVIYFKQINHRFHEVSNVIFKIDLNDKPETMSYFISELTKPVDYNVFNHDRYWESKIPKNHLSLLDKAFHVQAKCKDEASYQPILVVAGEVRDTDVDFITESPILAETLGINKEELTPFITPIDLKHGEDFSAKYKMTKLLFKMNELEWNKYESLKAEAHGDEYAVIEHKPFIPKFATAAELSQYVALVGEATPAEMYQSLEINILTKYITDLKVLLPDYNLNELTKPHPEKALRLLFAAMPKLDEHSLETFFIQHPTECRNKTEYTTNRGASVIVSQESISVANNDNDVNYILDKRYPNASVAINHKWLDDSHHEISGYAHVWLKHLLKNHVKYHNNDEIKKSITQSLTDNPDIKKQLLNDPTIKECGKSFLKSLTTESEGNSDSDAHPHIHHQ